MKAPFKLVTRREPTESGAFVGVLDCGHEVPSLFLQFIPNADRSLYYERDGKAYQRCTKCPRVSHEELS